MDAEQIEAGQQAANTAPAVLPPYSRPIQETPSGVFPANARRPAARLHQHRGRQQTGRRHHRAQQHGRQTVAHRRHVNPVDQGIPNNTRIPQIPIPISTSAYTRKGCRPARERMRGRAKLPRHNPPIKVASNTPSETAWNRSPVAATGTDDFIDQCGTTAAGEQQQQQRKEAARRAGV